MFKASVDDVVMGQLNEIINKLMGVFGADVLFVRAPMIFGIDDAIRHYIEMIVDNKQKPPSNTDTVNRLCVILETTGGSIEIVERITRVFRQHYQEVIFVIPNYAYSAGTVLALSGDEIYMDYYSVLGPIDPQLPGEDGKYIPAMGYLQKYNNLLKTVNSSSPEESRAELTLLISKFDPAKLFFIEQAAQNSMNLIKEWLPKYKFKNWSETESRKLRVTDGMKQERAESIAKILCDPERWHSHGRGIGIQDLTTDEIKLEIKDFGKDEQLNFQIRIYYDVISDYLNKKHITSALHSVYGLRSLS